MSRSREDLGNVAKKLHDQGCNVIPLDGKSPLAGVTWKQWQDEQQSAEDVDEMEFTRATGIGVINGMGNWRSIDIDGCELKFARSLLGGLGLPPDYEWLVETSGGYHIWIRCTDDGPGIEQITGDSNDPFKQIELRWSSCCTVVPPSKHPDGARYTFVNGGVSDAPGLVEFKQVVLALSDWHTSESTRQQGNDWSYGARTGEPSETKAVHPEVIKDALKTIRQETPRPGYMMWLKLLSGVADELGEDDGVRLMKDVFPPEDSDGKDYERKRGHLLDEITIGTVFHHAENAGWSRPKKKKTSDGLPDIMPTRAADIEPQPVDWIWEEYLARGVLHIVDGDPGVGKSTLLLGLLANLSNGATPFGESETVWRIAENRLANRKAPVSVL